MYIEKLEEIYKNAPDAIPEVEHVTAEHITKMAVNVINEFDTSDLPIILPIFRAAIDSYIGNFTEEEVNLGKHFVQMISFKTMRLINDRNELEKQYREMMREKREGETEHDA